MDSTLCACLLIIIGTLTSVNSAKKYGSSCTSSDECEVNTDCLMEQGDHRCLCPSNSIRETYGNQHCKRLPGVRPLPKTQNFGEDCIDRECVSPFDCDWNNRVDPKCKCGPSRPHHQGKGECVGRSYDEECDNKGFTYNDCMDPLICGSYDDFNRTLVKCGCRYPVPIWNSTGMFCHGPYHGEDCYRDPFDELRCHLGLKCVDEKCSCAGTSKPNWNMEKQQCDGKYNQEDCDFQYIDFEYTDSCLDGVLECSLDGKCECPHTSPVWNSTTMDCGHAIPFGGHCDTVSECAPPSETCDENKCACLKDRTLDREQNRCVPKSRKTFDADCTKNSSCITQYGLSCIGNKCKCTRDHVWALGSCQALSNLTKCEPTDIPNACDADVGQNLECGTSKVCNCPPNKEYSLHARSCKLKAGQSCSVNDVEEHDLCASQQCVSGTCACPDENGIKMIFSLEKSEGCVRNLHDMQCRQFTGNTANVDCHHKGYNSKRRTLRCEAGRCKCEDMFTYVRGYCIFAQHIDTQECDPSGRNSTCRLATDNSTASLTCRHGKCACLPMEVITATNPIQKKYTSLTWNENKTICDLKSDGDACTEGAECFGRECSSAKCGPMDIREEEIAGSEVFGPLTIFVFIGPIILNY